MQLPGLDALRGVLALTVCVTHAILMMAPGLWVLQNAVIARLAVIMFFVISGYVIALSIQNNRLRHHSFSWRAYASARLLRIVPPLVGCYILMIILWMLAKAFGITGGPGGLSVSTDDYRLNLGTLFLAVLSLGARGSLAAGLNDPLWTLQYEVQLYVVAGLGALAFYQKRVWPLLVAVVYLALAFRPFSATGASSQLVFYLCFLAGWAVQRAKFSGWWRHSLGLASLVASLVCFWAVWGGDLSSGNGSHLAQGLFGLAFAAFLPEIGLWPAPNILKRTGDFSYTLYIVHFPIFIFIVHALGRGLALAAASAVVAVAVAALLERSLGRPLGQRRSLKSLSEGRSPT